MDYQHTIETLSREVYQRLKLAVELGKWPNGRRLSARQREEALQAVIAWGELHLSERERVGYLEGGCNSARRTAPGSGGPQVYEPGRERG